MTSAVGFIMIIAIVVLLLKQKMSPIVVLIALPVVAAIILGTGITELGEMAKAGMSTVSNNAFLFIFSIIFFCVMSDVGVFDIIVNRLVKMAGDNVVLITVATGIVGIIAHLDGATATTVLISIPTMYPIYKKMGIRPHVLLSIVASAMGVMNLLPWGGPVARAATVLCIEATDLWIEMIPIQIAGVVTTIVLAVILGLIEKKRGAGTTLAQHNLVVDNDGEEKVLDERFRKLLPVNAILTVLVIGVLVWDQLPAYFFGLMPPILEVGEAFGVAAANTAKAMLIGKNVALMISPLVPATWLSLGLVDDVQIGEHIKFSVPWLYAISVIMVIVGFVTGIITF